jgi:hypothetical protein
MLNGKEPKIVNGPEVLNKYVGASEENIRNLFKASWEVMWLCRSIVGTMVLQDGLAGYIKKEG